MQVIKCTKSNVILTCELRKQEAFPFVNHHCADPITSAAAGTGTATTAGIAAAKE